LPGRAPLDPVEHPEAVADRLADTGEGAGQAGVEVGAAVAIGAIVKLVDHGDHPFLFRPGQSASGKASIRSLAGLSARSTRASRRSASRACHDRAVERSASALMTCTAGPS